jgi:hypothetical protein
MIITDGVHLTSTSSEAELHDFAVCKLLFRREWYQKHPFHPHYDLTTKNALKRALAHGAVKVSAMDILKNSWFSK